MELSPGRQEGLLQRVVSLLGLFSVLARPKVFWHLRLGSISQTVFAESLRAIFCGAPLDSSCAELAQRMNQCSAEPRFNSAISLP